MYFKFEIKDGFPAIPDGWLEHCENLEDGTYFLGEPTKTEPKNSWYLKMSRTWHGDFRLLSLLLKTDPEKIKETSKWMFKEAFLVDYEIKDGGEIVYTPRQNIITGEILHVTRSQGKLTKEQACEWIDIYRAEWQDIFENGPRPEGTSERGKPLYRVLGMQTKLDKLWYSEENKSRQAREIYRLQLAKG